MDFFELKREQAKLSHHIKLEDAFNVSFNADSDVNFDEKEYRYNEERNINEKINGIKTLGAAECLVAGSKVLATVVVCEFPSFKIKETKQYLLNNPLPYKLGFAAYREMPAIIEAVNQLEEEPDILLVKGEGVLHPRRFGIASHLGLELNMPTIGVQDKLTFGSLDDGKILFDGEVRGFEIKTKEYSNPLFVSPGHKISLKTAAEIISKTIIPPHKMPEPLHLVHKLGRKALRAKE